MWAMDTVRDTFGMNERIGQSQLLYALLCIYFRLKICLIHMSDIYIYIRYNLMWLIGSDTISFESSHKNSLLVLSFKLEDTYSYFLTFRIHSLLLHSNNACSFLLNIPLVCISISRIVLRWKCKTVRFLITSQCFEHKSWCNIM